MAYRFLRYLRRGAAAAIAQHEADPGGAPRPAFEVSLEVQRDGAAWRTVSPRLRLYGPGDIVALDPRQVLRSVPDPGSLAADAASFPFVELARPDLPWLFSPYAPTRAGDTLTPWLCLAVVKEQPGVSVEPGQPAGVLVIDAPATLDELPALTDAHAWAHVQLDSATAGDDLPALLRDHPELLRSRLVGARRLEASTSYWACVVPTFEGGRATGLGRPVDPATALDPAWRTGTPLPLSLPIHHAWRFTTSDADSFEQLARRLVPRADLGERVGTRPLDASSPGGGLPGPAPGDPPVTLRLDGALAIRGAGHQAPPPDLAAAIGGRLDLPHEVGPPRYGRWHAAAPPAGTSSGGAAPEWLDELNTDPVRRVAAAIGTQVVQRHQEELMAAAWEQVGEVLRANQLLRGAELALAASQRHYQRRVLPLLGDLTSLALAGPALPRVRMAVTTTGVGTVRGAVKASCLPLLAVSGGFRRLARPGGPLGRRLAASSDVQVRIGPLLARLGGGELRDTPPGGGSSALVVSLAELRTLARPRPPGHGPSDPGDAGELASLLPLLPTIAAVTERAAEPECAPLPVDDVRAALHDGLDPRTTIPARVYARLALPTDVWRPAPGVAPVLAAPRITTPMYRPLVEQGADWLLPGLGAVRPESIGILEPNRAFIESYLVGLNHEMARELLWRGYPTDQRCTVFDRFWDADHPDVTPLDGWRGALGGHPGPGRAAVMVVLLRGELVRRFPSATVFLQKARATGGAGGGRTPEPVIGGANTELPIFSGRLEPDVRFLGFGITSDTAKGLDPAVPLGYYLTFQELPGDLAFGPPATATPGGYQPPAGKADATAAAFMRRPFRLYMHADDLLP